LKLQKIKPSIPAQSERSADHCNKRKRFTTALLLFGTVLFPALSAAAESSPRHIWLDVRGDDHNGSAKGAYFLVSQPFSQVKAELEKRLRAQPALKGFNATDESAPLSRMEPGWADIAVSHHPEVQAALNQQIKEKTAATFTAALTAGVITAEERTRFEQAIAQQRRYDKDTMDGTPFFSQRITRWSYRRHRGTSHRYNNDYIKIMDVSPLLGRVPVTLVWFSGTWTKITNQGRGRYSSTTITRGDVPLPDLQDNTKGDKRLVPKLSSFMRIMAKTAKRMPVLSNEDTRDALRAYSLGAFGREEAVPEIVDMTVTPTTDVQGSDLPADEDHVRPAPNYSYTWQMLALPDGSVLASGSASHRFVQRGAEVERLDGMPSLYAVDDLKIDPAGTVWGHGITSDGARFFKSWSPASGSGATYQVCNPDHLSVLPLELSLDQMSRTCTPRYPDDWVVQPGQGIAFSSGAELFTLDKEGKWTHRTWDEKLRHTVSDALNQAMPLVDHSAILIRSGDGLLWRADHDGYGIDPTTARVVRSIATPHEGIFFGSLSANWGFGFSALLVLYDNWPFSPDILWPYPGNFRVTDLATGKPLLDVTTGSFICGCNVARSAHGRLLAINDSSGLAIVLDMKEGKPLARLRMPKDYMIDAMAFSWQGDKLWLYARKAAASGGRKMIVWDIPAGQADAAQGMDVPDQLRFNFDKIFRCGGACDF